MKFYTLFLFMFFIAVPADAKEGKIVDFEVGATGVLTGSLWNQPQNIPNYSNLPYDSTQAFLGGGGGVYFRAKFIEYIGLEIDFLYENNGFQENVTVNGTGGSGKYENSVRYKQWRIPVLLMGIVPSKYLDFSIMTGPEFCNASDGSINLTNLRNMEENSLNSIEKGLKIKPQSDKYWLTGLNFTFKANRVRIPFQLRWSYNLTKSDDYQELVDFQGNNSMTLKASEDHLFSVMLGLGAFVYSL